MYSFAQMLRRAALVNRDGIASRFQGHRTTWAETLDRVQRIAAVLRRLGLGPGDRVAILAGNSECYFQLLFAIPWAGGVVVPINTRLGSAEIAHCLTDSGSRLLVVDDAFLRTARELRELAPGIGQFVYAGHAVAPEGFVALDPLLEASAPAPAAGCGGSDLYALYYTGGTTGRAKGVMLTHEGMITNTLQWALEIGVGRDDVLLVVAPMFHLVGGLNAIAAAALGAGLCLMPRFEPRAVLQTIASERITKAALVPTMMSAIVSHPDIARFDLSSLRRISYGGSPISETLLRRTLEVMPQVLLHQVYGQTEGGPNICILKPQDHQLAAEGSSRLASAGQPIAGTEVAILDADDTPLGAGQVGEICVRGLTVSPGYWNLPEETARAQRGGWLHTGDAGYLDADGFVYIVDRIKDMIITGGENVYSQEVENVLYAHPAVAECAVFGIPDERWGERVHAVVRLREGCSASRDELIAHCRRQLATYKCIRSVDFRTEPFPLSGANKVLKRDLKAPYWQSHSRQV
ncbi:MAG: long-chain fatty acid--CoA ligase [Gammaproteobacteria bacterium]|nr:long-chain fatty acid--CoA ligase [Gammaproteobacteria bacterium]